MKKFERFWLSFVAVAVLSFVFFDLATIARAEEFTITGYGIGEFAVKDDVERQAEKMIESWGTKKPAKIIIQGFADKTGKTAENDSIARDRASEMKAFLESKTDAKIAAISKGESEDARKVVITVEFGVAIAPVVPKAVVPKAEKSMGEKALDIFLLSFGIVVVAVVSFVLVGLILRRNRTTKEKKQAPVLEPFPETHLSDEPLNITIDEHGYEFYPEVASDGRFKTLHQLEKGKFLFVSDRKELKRSLRSSFKNHPDLASGLLKQGRLKLQTH